jgi:hypothetical protein
VAVAEIRLDGPGPTELDRIVLWSNAAVEKKRLLKDVAILAGSARSLVKESTQELQKNIQTIRSKRMRLDTASEIEILCYNVNLAWSDALVRLEQDTLERHLQALTSQQVLQVAIAFEKAVTRGLPGLSLDEILDTVGMNGRVGLPVLEDLCCSLPVMSIKKRGVCAVFDIHTVFSFDEYLEAILALGIQQKKQAHVETDRSHTGRKSYTQLYPTLIPRLREHLHTLSTAAQNRRRSSAETAVSVHLADLLDFVKKNFAFEPSPSYLHTLTLPAREGTAQAERHSGELNIRVPRKDNSGITYHVDGQHDRAQHNSTRELHVLFKDVVQYVAFDDMNQILVGPMAVSRYHQIDSYFAVGDAPRMDSHDFPVAGYKISASGYVDVAPRAQHSADNLIEDEHGREHVSLPASGPVYMVNRAKKFHAVNILTHMQDIEVLLRGDKEALNLSTDSGPGVSMQSVVTTFFMGRLFHRKKKALLMHSGMAPGQSALHLPEHAWSPNSKDLAGVRFAATLEGETKPPVEQSGLSFEELVEKEAKVFNDACEELDAIWNQGKWDGYERSSRSIPCLSVHDGCPFSVSASGKRSVQRDHPEFELVSLVLMRKKVPKDKQKDALAILKENRLIVKHVDRRARLQVFMLCEDQHCEWGCTDQFAALQPRTQELLRLLRGLCPGLNFPVLTPDPDCQGHYRTLLQTIAAGKDGLLRNLTPDQYKPSINAGLGRCKEDGCCWVFLSAADAKRHRLSVHQKTLHGKRKVKTQRKRPIKQYSCDAPGCVFRGSQRGLRKHRKENGHKARKGRPKTVRSAVRSKQVTQRRSSSEAEKSEASSAAKSEASSGDESEASAAASEASSAAESEASSGDESEASADESEASADESEASSAAESEASSGEESEASSAAESEASSEASAEKHERQRGQKRKAQRLDSDFDIACNKCGSTDWEPGNELVLCEYSGMCKSGTHLRCMSPPLTVVPRDRFFCVSCEEKTQRTRGGRRAAPAAKFTL